VARPSSRAAVRPADGTNADERDRRAAQAGEGTRLGAAGTNTWIAAAITVAKRLHLLLHLLLRRDSQERLDGVLDSAAGTSLASFAASIRRDQAAVQAALNLPWTSSPAEGQINRLKTLKRSMYGRAGFQLLRARVLQAA
jgi:transposase